MTERRWHDVCEPQILHLRWWTMKLNENPGATSKEELCLVSKRSRASSCSPLHTSTETNCSIIMLDNLHGETISGCCDMKQKCDQED